MQYKEASNCLTRSSFILNFFYPFLEVNSDGRSSYCFLLLFSSTVTFFCFFKLLAGGWYLHIPLIPTQHRRHAWTGQDFWRKGLLSSLLALRPMCYVTLSKWVFLSEAQFLFVFLGIILFKVFLFNSLGSGKSELAMCTGTLLQNHIFSKWDIWVGRIDQATFPVVDLTFKQLKKNWWQWKR